MLTIASLLILGGLIGLGVTIIGLINHKISKSETKASPKPAWISLAAVILGLILVPVDESKSTKTASAPAASSPTSVSPLPAGFTADARFDPRSPGGLAVLTVLRDRCRRLIEGNADLESARFSHFEATDKEFEFDGRKLPFVPDGLNWNVVERLTIKVKDNATGSLSEAQGNVCEFDFGGGSEPGILTAKGACASLCRGLPEVEQGNYFGEEPRLQVIEAAASSKKAAAERIASNHGQLKQLERKALAGDYQARRNLAYGYEQGDFSIERDYVIACAWREIIVESGDEQVDDSDRSNRDSACSSMPPNSEERVQVLKQQFRR